jgi:type II secretory pathway component GspD/PulD (secretin)
MKRLNHMTALVLGVILLCVFSYRVGSAAETDAVEVGEPQKKTEKKYVSDDGIVHLRREMDIIDLIKAVSEINEEIYLIENDIKPKEVSIITPEAGMKKGEVLRLFEIILSMNGLTVVKTQGINKVVYSVDIKQQNTPVESGD